MVQLKLPVPCRIIRRLLVIEDDPSYQILIARYFQSLFPGIVIRICSTHDEARTELFRMSGDGRPYFDLVIADHFLPDGYGYDMWQTSQLDPEISGRFVLISGMTVDEFSTLCGIRPWDPMPRYVSKLGSPAQFATRFRDLLQSMASKPA